MNETQPEEQAQCWLILTTVVQQVPTPAGAQNIATRVVSWDFATKNQMETFWKKQLGLGTHYLVLLENAITIENIVQTEPLIKMN